MDYSNFKIDMPNDVDFIINTIKSHGHQAYAVGGCVRDSIMGLTPNDWDITTSALPSDIKEYFNKTIDTGIEHGTVTVMLHNKISFLHRLENNLISHKASWLLHCSVLLQERI